MDRNEAYWTRKLWVDAFIREAERQKREKDRVERYWPHPVPKEVKEKDNG